MIDTTRYSYQHQFRSKYLVKLIFQPSNNCGQSAFFDKHIEPLK